MIGGPSIIFCWYAEAGKSQICKGAKTCVILIGYNAYSLYLYCSSQEMLCGKERYGKERYVKVERPEDTEELCNHVMKGELLEFLQVDIHVPDYLKERFSEFCSLFIVDTIREEAILRQMKEYH